jgi:hypothetical protein
MKFLINCQSEARVVTMWHCSNGNIYIEGRYTEQAGYSVTGTAVELEAVLKQYCLENGYEFIGKLYTEE